MQPPPRSTLSFKPMPTPLLKPEPLTVPYPESKAVPTPSTPPAVPSPSATMFQSHNPSNLELGLLPRKCVATPEQPPPKQHRSHKPHHKYISKIYLFQPDR